MHLTAVALCKEVLFDKFTNTFSFIHIIERVRPAQYPFALGGISLGMILDVQRQVQSLAIGIACNQAGQPPTIVANFAISNVELGPQKIHARISEIMLSGPGRHECSIFVNDGSGQRLLAILPIYADQPQQAGG